MRRDLNDWLSCRTNSAVCGRPTGHRRACGEFVSISGSKPQQKEVALEWADARNMHDFFFFFFSVLYLSVHTDRERGPTGSEAAQGC